MLELSQEINGYQVKCASSWHTIPFSEHNFALHKDAFCDALALLYRWINITDIGAGSDITPDLNV